MVEAVQAHVANLLLEPFSPLPKVARITGYLKPDKAWPQGSSNVGSSPATGGLGSGSCDRYCRMLVSGL